MAPIRILIVDDHLVVRRGLRSMLAGAEEVHIVGEASNGREAIELAASLRPDVVLLDIRMPGMDGLQVLRTLKSRQPELKVIVLTVYDDEQFLCAAFSASADGYLLKNVGREELLRTVHTVRSGKRALSEELIDSVLGHLGEMDRKRAADRFGLSEREVELLRMASEGKTNRQIAHLLYWSEATVKRRFTEIFQKLCVSTRAQAVASATRHGLL